MAKRKRLIDRSKDDYSWEMDLAALEAFHARQEAKRKAVRQFGLYPSYGAGRTLIVYTPMVRELFGDLPTHRPPHEGATLADKRKKSR